MKKIFSDLLLLLKHYLNGSEQKRSTEKNTVNPDILTTINQAFTSKSAVHVIYGSKNFTGHILRLDKDKSQLFLENFKGSITMIIDLQEIKRISILPPSLQRIVKT
ncbi:hypothetical protein [Streptococcus merionis]|uniref:hypothetical protein n=1 Tax=Streptococcus merionis TaxID=400065 RepID=UPI0026E97825|nr:hypothetical protein [Streptococcus merionis]